jgi:hypothetical protein
MTIISQPVEVLKDQDNVFTLDKSQLALEAKIIADPYFSDQANWNKVILAYLTDTGKQVEFVTFDATQTTPTGNFRVSSKARNLFQIDALILQDFDGGYLRFERDELTVGDFDVDFGASAPVSDTKSYDWSATGGGPSVYVANPGFSSDIIGNVNWGMSLWFKVKSNSGQTRYTIAGTQHTAPFSNDLKLVVDDGSIGTAGDLLIVSGNATIPLFTLRANLGSIKDSAWHNIIISSSDILNTTTVYLDGQSVFNNVGNTYDLKTNWYFGNILSTGDNQFLIAQGCIYNTYISATNVVEIYNSGSALEMSTASAPLLTKLEHYYRFGDSPSDTNNIIIDQAGSEDLDTTSTVGNIIIVTDHP